MHDRHRTQWRVGAAALGAVAFLGFAIPVANAGTTPTTSSANQGETLTVTSAAGTLSVSTALATVAFPNTAKGANTGMTADGDVSYTNTLADGSGWSVTVAGTDLRSAPPVMNGITCGGDCIPFTAETFSTGQTKPRKAPSGKDFTPARLVEAVRELARHGLRARRLDGGYPRWKQAGLPVAAGGGG